MLLVSGDAVKPQILPAAAVCAAEVRGASWGIIRRVEQTFRAGELHIGRSVREICRLPCYASDQLWVYGFYKTVSVRRCFLASPLDELPLLRSVLIVRVLGHVNDSKSLRFFDEGSLLGNRQTSPVPP